MADSKSDQQQGKPSDFSAASRARSLHRLEVENFDLLIIGGGITGVATARDAARRGLKVALVESRDFAYGTSSRSSKLIHGGLRYLENLEFALVSESLSERALLLKTMPSMVRPLAFYLPAYEGAKRGMGILDLGLWFYDLLALFRTPGFHKRLSRDQLLKEMPFLKKDGLVGGFRYYDASMWDDVMGVEIARAAQDEGAAIVSRVEAFAPLWSGERIAGFEVKDVETGRQFPVRATRTVICTGPWTDITGRLLERNAPAGTEWKHWLAPSKGVHLIFDLKRVPVPGAVVMSHPTDGRIAFVIPRPDFGPGVVVVGTTDGETHADPDRAEVVDSDIQYLMGLLQANFPELGLTSKDIISTYVGVRPLVDPARHGAGGGSLQKVSREHEIEAGPGGVTVVAGGKYTTHRTMAAEIVDKVLHQWNDDARSKLWPAHPMRLARARTEVPPNPAATPQVISEARVRAGARGLEIPECLWSRYGAAALEIAEFRAECGVQGLSDPPGFPWFEAQFLYSLRHEMVVHLEDFWFRRQAVFASLSDHAQAWMEPLSRVWARELGRTEAQRVAELDALKKEIQQRSTWKQGAVGSGGQAREAALSASSPEKTRGPGIQSLPHGARHAQV